MDKLSAAMEQEAEAEQLRRPQNGQLLSVLTDNAGDAIEVIDAATLDYADVNQTACDVLGYSREEFLTMNVRDVDPAVDEKTIQRIDSQLSTSGSMKFETVHRCRDGTLIPVEVNVKRVVLDRPYNVSFVRDISDRKRTEQEMSRLNWALQALSRSNAAVVRAEDEETLYQRCCEAIAGVDAYPLAWISMAREDEKRTIECVAASGPARDYLKDLSLSWAEGSSVFDCPSGTAIRTGQTQVIDDLWNSPVFRPWRDRARRFGLASLITVPIIVDRKPLGVLAVCGRQIHAFDQGVQQPLHELADVIAYAVASRRLQQAFLSSLKDRASQADRLHRTMEGAVAALAATVKYRDPYTAGHQSRVADLAVAIGTQLRIDEDSLNGLRVASSLHDIGKIAVPGEILTRPGHLSEVEMAVVRTHVETGYQIIKGIDFPWPVAEIVYQHHERLDGSGYPRGLTGGRIIPEARILAVADTVEAMVSHRPYRAAQGLKAALAQIREDSGSKLDADVVTACCRLFEQGCFYFT